MVASFAFFLIFLLTGKPTDLVSFLEPRSALEALGEPTDEAGLKRLIEGKPGAVPAGGALDEKAVQRAVENLASSDESVRAKARDDLSAVGEAARARLEDVAKNDPRRAAEAKVVIAVLDTASRAAANRSRTSRLLAVRLAGDLKISALADVVRAAGSSTDPFLREAAAETLARIEGKDPPPPPERPWAKSLATLEAFPKGTNYLVDVPMATAFAAHAGATAPRIDRVLGPMAALMGPDSAEVLRQATKDILDFVGKCGNLRADRVTLANVGVLGKKAGLAIIVSGEYDPALLENGLRSLGSWKLEDVAGKKALISEHLRIVLLDDHHVILLPQNASDNFPLAEYVSALAAGSKPLRGEPRWAKFLENAGSSGRALVLLQASLIPPEQYANMERDAPSPEVAAALRGWKELEAEAKAMDSKKVGLRLEAEFAEAKHASDIAAFVKGKLAEAIGEMETQSAHLAGTPMEAMMKSGLEILKSIQVTTEDKKGALRAELDPGTLLPTLMGTASQEVRAVPPPDEP
jgi:hypothetical protein